MSEQLDSLRGSLKQIVEYEARQQRSPRHKREKLRNFRQHLALWNRTAAAAGSTEACPLLALIEAWCGELGEPLPERDKRPQPPAATSAGANRRGGRGRRRGGRQPAEASGEAKSEGGQQAAQASGGAPAQGGNQAAEASGGAEDGKASVGDASDAPGEEEKLLGKGDWLKSHATIVLREVPQVKAEAADPEKYSAAKRSFLERNLPKLRAYIKKPAKGHSPLFAYCALYLYDTGDLKGALALCEDAIRLRQGSPLKRDFHELQFDLQLMHLEAEAEQIAAEDKKGKRYEELRALRDALMASQFRSNHAKARVCKVFATLAHALGEHETAKENLLRVKFLDPHMGVETLLGQVETALGQ